MVLLYLFAKITKYFCLFFISSFLPVFFYYLLKGTIVAIKNFPCFFPSLQTFVICHFYFFLTVFTSSWITFSCGVCVIFPKRIELILLREGEEKKPVNCALSFPTRQHACSSKRGGRGGGFPYRRRHFSCKHGSIKK